MTTQISKEKAPPRNFIEEKPDPRDKVIAALVKVVAVSLISNNQLKQLGKDFLASESYLGDQDFTTLASKIIDETTGMERAFEILLKGITQEESAEVISTALNGQKNKILEGLLGELKIGN